MVVAMADGGASEPVTRPVDPATAAAARESTSEPWASRWRALPDGSLQVAREDDHRIALLVFRAGSDRPELVAQSEQKSLLLRMLGGAWILAFFALFLVFAVSPWFAALLAVLIGVIAVGVVRDPGLTVEKFLVERGAEASWTRMPRVVGEAPASGNQLIALCALAEEHKRHVCFRNLLRGTVEVAVPRDRGYDVLWIDRAGVLRKARSVERGGPSVRKLRKLEGRDPDWHELRTDSPPSD